MSKAALVQMVHSLARDLAQYLGTVGHVGALRRTCVGPFHENHAIALDKLGDMIRSATKPV